VLFNLLPSVPFDFLPDEFLYFMVLFVPFGLVVTPLAPFGLLLFMLLDLLPQCKQHGKDESDDRYHYAPTRKCWFQTKQGPPSWGIWVLNDSDHFVVNGEDKVLL
jgi:hypothetical protein